VAGYQGLEDGLWRAAWPWVVFGGVGYHAALISSRLRAVWRLSGSAHASSARRSPSVCGAAHRVSL